MSNNQKAILGIEEVLRKIEEHTGKRNPMYAEQAKLIEEQCAVLNAIADNIQSAFFNEPQKPLE